MKIKQQQQQNKKTTTTKAIKEFCYGPFDPYREYCACDAYTLHHYYVIHTLISFFPILSIHRALMFPVVYILPNSFTLYKPFTSCSMNGL